jgi:hypothetical protein
MVWEVPEGPGNVPGILEYKGEGLKALERALDTKQDQIAAIGGRLMPGAGKGSESPHESALRESSEQSLILNVIQAAEAGMSYVVRWWIMWRDVPLSQSEDAQVSINLDFTSQAVDARELRAITLLHDEGKVPLEVLYNALLSSEYLDPETTIDEFKAMLADPSNFPNNPDIQARQRGFDSRQQELDQASVAREADMEQQEIDLQEREVEMMEAAPPPLPPAAPKAAGPTPRPPAGGKVKQPGSKPKAGTRKAQPRN